MSSRTEMPAPLSPEDPAVGSSKWELDTPALCVDLDAMELNLRTMQRTMLQHGIASRPHIKTHKCPAIAKLQLESGSIGICTAKVSEAETMFRDGVDQILMTTISATPFKMQRAMSLRAFVRQLHPGHGHPGECPTLVGRSGVGRCRGRRGRRYRPGRSPDWNRLGGTRFRACHAH